MRLGRYEEASPQFQRAEDLAREQGLAARRVRGDPVPHLPRHHVPPRRRRALARRTPGGAPGARQPRRRDELLRRSRPCSRSCSGDAQAGARSTRSSGLEAVRARRCGVLPGRVSACGGQRVRRCRRARARAGGHRGSARGWRAAATWRRWSRSSCSKKPMSRSRRATPPLRRRRLRKACRAAAPPTARSAAYVHRIVARKPVLLVLALRDGIELELVRQLIRRWRVPPPPRRHRRVAVAGQGAHAGRVRRAGATTRRSSSAARRRRRRWRCSRP